MGRAEDAEFKRVDTIHKVKDSKVNKPEQLFNVSQARLTYHLGN